MRIEDIDATRARPEFEAAIYEDLAWLGLAWEEPVLRQSERFDAYRKALDELDQLGLLYPAFLTRAEIAAWRRRPDRPGRAIRKARRSIPARSAMVGRAAAG